MIIKSVSFPIDKKQQTTKVNTMDDFGNAPINTIVCPKCVNDELSYAIKIIPVKKEILQYDSWCSEVMCPTCQHTWYVCRDCFETRVIIDTKKKLVNHAWKKHRINKSNNNVKGNLLGINNSTDKSHGQDGEVLV